MKEMTVLAGKNARVTTRPLSFYSHSVTRGDTELIPACFWIEQNALRQGNTAMALIHHAL